MTQGKMAARAEGELMPPRHDDSDLVPDGGFDAESWLRDYYENGGPIDYLWAADQIKGLKVEQTSVRDQLGQLLRNLTDGIAAGAEPEPLLSLTVGHVEKLLRSNGDSGGITSPRGNA